MSAVTIVVTSNGEIFKNGLNAVATIFGPNFFTSAFRLSVLFAIFSMAFHYIKSQDFKVFGHWFVLYFFVSAVVIGPKVTVHIQDLSQPPSGSTLMVDNVPLGLAYPASFITTLSYRLTEAMETVFHLPDDAEYSKTGMLFGSKLFSLSSQSHFLDPELNAVFNRYFENCVVGDIYLNNKYSMNDLKQSNDLWKTIAQKPSPLRRVLYQGELMTCAEVTPKIAEAIQKDASQNLTALATLFMGGSTQGKDITEGDLTRIQKYLMSSYNYYANVSHTAEEIMTQNMIMNGLREGVLNYNTQMGASAAMLNISETQAMQKMRLTWATLGNVAAYELPLTSTVLLLLVLCVFPIISLLMVHLDFGLKVFKSYVYTLIWLGSWPILYAILNMAVTFYLHQKTGGGNGFTLSNANPLVLMHSDIAGIAKYLMGTIPFISIGLVMGMASAFNQAANYIGGMTHSVASGSASEVSSGNISLGNTNINNAHANKLDTNFSSMQGMQTSQLANGALVTETSSGETLYDTSHAISHLSNSIHFSTNLSDHFSKASESALMSAKEVRETNTRSLHEASQQLASFGKSSAFHEAKGHNYAVNQSTSYDQAASNLHSITNAVAERNHVGYSAAYQGLTERAEGLDAHVGVGRNFIMSALGLDAGAKAHLGIKHSNTNHESTAHDKGDSVNVTSEEAKQFRENWAKVASYSDHEHAESQHAHNNTWLSQFSADLRKSEDLAHQVSAHESDSRRYSEMANFAKTHSATFGSDGIQLFVDHLKKIVPDRAQTLLTHPENPRIAEELKVYADRFIHSEYGKHFEARYADFQKQHAVHPFYHQAAETLQKEEQHVQALYQNEHHVVRAKATQGHTHFNHQKLEDLQQTVHSNQFVHETEMNEKKADEHKQEETFNQSTHEKIDYVTQLSDRSPIGGGLVKPNDFDKKFK